MLVLGRWISVRPNVRANRPAMASAVGWCAIVVKPLLASLTALAVAGPVERGVRPCGLPLALHLGNFM